jgi:hypothetical protein
MITFDFYIPDEKLPKHDEEIVFIRKVAHFGNEYFDVRSGIIEYVWEEVDENGEYTGNSLFYDADDFMDNPNVMLNILIADHSGCYNFFDYVFCWNYPFNLEKE